jgi:hypothetical protein
VPEANEAEKLRDHGYMELGYLGFVNDVSVKRVDSPTKGDMGCFARKKKRPSRMTTKKLSKCWKQRIFTITKEIKNNLG